jgi:hypothetical protein
MFALTWKTEGIKGFYRGYSCYMVAIIFWMSSLHMMTDFLMLAVPQMLEGRNKTR